MKRFVLYLCVVVVVAILPFAILAGASQAAPLAVVATPQAVTGKVLYVGDSTLTIVTGGRPLGMINALTAAANALTRRDYPYVYGGGHEEAGVASIGIRGGPGYNGRRIGYDCSGSVAAVLAGAGLWAPGSGVPADNGVISQLLADKLIARGPGTAPDEVTLYDDPGVHIFMNIDGRFFGTSDGGGGNPKGGPGWLDDGAPDSLNHAYKRYHVLASVLKDRTTYGHSFTFQTAAHPSILTGAEVGDKVRINYAQTRSGAMSAQAIQYVGAVTTSATVESIAPDGSSVTVQTSGGRTLALSTTMVTDLLSRLQVGDGVQVTYSKDLSGLLIPHALVVSSTPAQ